MSFYDQHNNGSEEFDSEENYSTTMMNNNEETTTGGDGLLRDLSNYIPDYLQQHLQDVSFKDLKIPFLTATQNDENKESIIWSEFDIVHFDNKRKLFLTIAYINGFSIWEVTKPSKPICLLSKRNVTLKIAKFLPEPKCNSGERDPFIDSRPLVALVIDDSDNGTTLNDVTFYSLRRMSGVSVLQLDSEICKITANQRHLIVSTQTEIRGFDPLLIQKQPQFTFSVCPSPTPFGVLALGHRWIAYPGNEDSDTQVLDNPSQTLAERSLDVAKNITSGLYYIGDLGVRKLSDYMQQHASQRSSIPQRPRSSSSSSLNDGSEDTAAQDEESQNAGIVTLRDTHDGKLLIRFRAHMKRISQMAFDSTGTLLVTAPIEGNYLHVYQIMGRHIRHLYKLYRGVTSADIHDIKFSLNSRWIAVSTSHGTTHIFAINPTGGVVSSHTHTRSGQNKYGASPEKQFYMEATQKKIQEPIVVSVCGRIRQVSLFSNDANPSNFYSIPVSTIFWECPSVTTERILVATSKGFLSQYIMRPSESENDPEKLVVKMDETDKTDICRSYSDEEQEIDYFKALKLYFNDEEIPSSEENNSEDDEYSQWLSNVETETYEMPALPLWISGQFKFKVRDEYPSLEDIGNTEDTSLDSLATSVYIRRTEPIPIIQNDGNPDYDLMQSVVMVPSAPPLTDDGFYGSIISAMETPMDGYEPSRRSTDASADQRNPPEYNPSHKPSQQGHYDRGYIPHNHQDNSNGPVSLGDPMNAAQHSTTHDNDGIYPSVNEPIGNENNTNTINNYDNNSNNDDNNNNNAHEEVADKDAPTVQLNKSINLQFKENFYGYDMDTPEEPPERDSTNQETSSPWQSQVQPSYQIQQDSSIAMNNPEDIENEGSVKMFGSLKDSLKTDFYQTDYNPENNGIGSDTQRTVESSQTPSSNKTKQNVKKKRKNSNNTNHKKRKSKKNREKNNGHKSTKTNQKRKNSNSSNNYSESESETNGEGDRSFTFENNLIEEIPISTNQGQKDYDLSSSDLSL